LVAISAIGARTVLRDMRNVARQAIVQIGILTLALAALVAVGFFLIGSI
jgi:hypothetical protein